MSSEQLGTCYRKALDLLARRPHFRLQLVQKLQARSFSHDEVAQVCARLEEEKLLDDQACALALVSGPLRRKGYGPRRLRAELARRGASPEVADQVIAESLGDGEFDLARDVAHRWLTRNKLDRQALARHLERKGHLGGVIARVLNDPACMIREPDS